MDEGEARAFFKSYEAATRAGDGEALASHYAEPYTSFTLGHVGQFATRAVAIAIVTPWLARLREFGVNDVHLVDLAITPVSDSFCLCHPTWEIRPADGTPPWRFVNVYGLRQDDRGQRLEFSIADNEAAGFMKRHPGLMPG